MGGSSAEISNHGMEPLCDIFRFKGLIIKSTYFKNPKNPSHTNILITHPKNSLEILFKNLNY